MTDLPAEKPIVLIGFMATGKTTVGRLVARRTGRDFVDLDQAITETAGMSVADIFKREGEMGFRVREAVALEQALARPATVIATGGGAACREKNLAAMLTSGIVVALSIDAEEVVRRTGGATGRPLLDGQADPAAAARKLLQEREPFYARAHVRVETMGKSPEAVADEILSAIGALAN